MRLNLAADESGGAYAGSSVGECDPLPPQDRVSVPAHDHTLETLYRAEAPRLLRLFSNRSGNDDPIDLVHEAFERLARGGTACLRAIERPEAYLSRIARNLLHNRTKSAARRFSALHIPIEDVSLPGADPHNDLETRDMVRRLETAMQSLPPRTREIFMACRLDGYTYAEVAERTGMSVRGVRKLMSRAIASVDRALSED